MSKMVTSGTGHDPVPVSARAPRAPGRHLAVATKELAKPVLVSRGGQKKFPPSAGLPVRNVRAAPKGFQCRGHYRKGLPLKWLSAAALVESTLSHFRQRRSVRPVLSVIAINRFLHWEQRVTSMENV